MAGETALYIVLVVDLESLIELGVFTLVAPTGEGVVVPKDTITLVGYEERNRDLGVVLVELLILSTIVELLGLMLAETVDCVIGTRNPFLTEDDTLVGLGVLGVGLGDDSIAHYATILTENRRAVEIEESDVACLLADDSLQLLSGYYERRVGLGGLVVGEWRLWHHHETLVLVEDTIEIGRNSNDLVINDLETELLTVLQRDDNAIFRI